MKIRPHHLPPEISQIAENLRSQEVEQQTILHPTIKNLLLIRYVEGPTEHSSTIGAENAIGEYNEAQLHFTKHDQLKFVKIKRELGFHALWRTIIKTKRDTYKASQAEIVSCLLQRADQHLA